MKQLIGNAIDSLFNVILLLPTNSKEAQKCFCGSANCRGYLGGENRVSIRAAGGKMKKERSRKKDSVSVVLLWLRVCCLFSFVFPLRIAATEGWLRA